MSDSGDGAGFSLDVRSATWSESKITRRPGVYFVYRWAGKFKMPPGCVVTGLTLTEKPETRYGVASEEPTR